MNPENMIPFVDLAAQYNAHREEFDAAMHEVIAKTAFIGGPAVQKFEAAFAQYVGVPHAVGVGNGTDALYLALRAMGIGPGDEVITACNSFIATSEAISMTGAKPVFADVEADTALIDLKSVERALSKQTKAIIPVHLYGQLVDMKPLLALAASAKLKVLEDCAQAHGATEYGQRAGSFGLASGFSFYPGKNLGAYGDAGAVATTDAELAAQVRKIANHGRADKFGHEIEGVNSRLDGIQAALLSAKLRHIETWTQMRQKAADRYTRMFREVPGVTPFKVRTPNAHVFHLFVVQVDDREGLKKHLEANNIQCGIHYPVPLHLLRAYQHLNYKKGSFPVAEQMSEHTISLPIFPEITENQQIRVVETVQSFVRQSSVRGGR